jgi:riboflavin-specific deaminase-like protein
MSKQSIFDAWLDERFVRHQPIPFLAEITSLNTTTIVREFNELMATRPPTSYALTIPVLQSDHVKSLSAFLSHYPCALLTIGWLETEDVPFSFVRPTNDQIVVALQSAMQRYTWINDHNTPYVTLSYGMSMDGKIATYTGDSKYISGPETRAMVHDLRHRYDAILVGIQTIRVDHPSLTTRRDGLDNRDAHRIILDSSLSIDEHELILSLHSNAQTHIVCKAHVDLEKVKRLEAKGVVIHVDASQDTTISLEFVLKTLQKFHIYSILVEGGGTVHFSFIKDGLFNDIYAQISPLILGGKDAKTPVEGQGFPTLKEAKYVAFVRYFQYGRDIVIYARNLARE